MISKQVHRNISSREQKTQQQVGEAVRLQNTKGQPSGKVQRINKVLLDVNLQRLMLKQLAESKGPSGTVV